MCLSLQGYPSVPPSQDNMVLPPMATFRPGTTMPSTSYSSTSPTINGGGGSSGGQGSQTGDAINKALASVSTEIARQRERDRERKRQREKETERQRANKHTIFLCKVLRCVFLVIFRYIHPQITRIVATVQIHPPQSPLHPQVSVSGVNRCHQVGVTS